MFGGEEDVGQTDALERKCHDGKSVVSIYWGMWPQGIQVADPRDGRCLRMVLLTSCLIYMADGGIAISKLRGRSRWWRKQLT